MNNDRCFQKMYRTSRITMTWELQSFPWISFSECFSGFLPPPWFHLSNSTFNSFSNMQMKPAISNWYLLNKDPDFLFDCHVRFSKQYPSYLPHVRLLRASAGFHTHFPKPVLAFLHPEFHSDEWGYLKVPNAGCLASLEIYTLPCLTDSSSEGSLSLFCGIITHCQCLLHEKVAATRGGCGFGRVTACSQQPLV